MALDPYALCPCGNGQKVKFCCSADIIHELDKVLRSIEGDQRAAALDQLNRLLTARPNNPALLAIKTSIQLSTGDYEGAQKTVNHFLAVDPRNPTALSQGAAIAALQGNVRQAVERMQAALEEANGQLSHQVHETMHIVSDVLLATGEIMGAYGHAMFYASTARPEDEQAHRVLARIRMSPQLPLFLRQERFLERAPDDANWKAKFDEAMSWAGKGCWLKACEQFIALAERVHNEPRIIKNIAVLRGYLADTSGAVLWWHKYASLEQVPLEDRIEAEALAQMLDPNQTRDKVDVVQTVFTLHDSDRAMERLLADKRLAIENRDAYVAQLEEGEVPPKAVFTLLDRVMPATGVDIALADLPKSVGDVLLYGRQTDREPRLELTCERMPQLDIAKATLTEVLGDALKETSEEVVGQELAEAVALRISMYPPRDTPRTHYMQLVDEARRKVITEVWPHTKNRFLDGKTPVEAAANPHLRIRLQASIFQMEAANAGNADFDYNQLRSQLGLETFGKIDPEGINIMHLPAWRLARLELEKLSDEQLMAGFQRAVYYADGASLRALADTILARESMSQSIDPREVYELLIQLLPDPSQSVEYAVRAQEYAKSKGDSPARYMLMELQGRVALGDGQRAQALIQTLSTVYRSEPGIAQALMQILVQLGVMTPDGRMRAPAGAPSPAMAGGMGAEASPVAGGVWTPDAPAAAQGEKKSGLWLPGMD
jgi:tetratricopeptide (TPR) repeat protein